MDIYNIFMSDIVLKLSYSLYVGLAFHIAHSSSYFDDSDGIFVGGLIFFVESVFYLVRDVGDNLYRSSAVVSVTLFADN